VLSLLHKGTYAAKGIHGTAKLRLVFPYSATLQRCKKAEGTAGRLPRRETSHNDRDEDQISLTSSKSKLAERVLIDYARGVEHYFL